MTRSSRACEKAAAVIVLLSAESSRRIWTSFESGFGLGAGARVVPVILRGFAFSQLPYPLAGIQGRSVEDIGFIVDDIAKGLDWSHNTIDVDTYLDDLQKAEASLNYKSIRVEPCLEGNNLFFDISNVGNIDAELLMLEVMIPASVRFQNTVIAMEWEMLARSMGGRPYTWFACYSPRGAYLGFQHALRPVITPSMSKFRPRVPITIRGPLSAEQLDMPIYFQVHAVGYRTQMEQRRLGDLGAQ